MTEKDNGEEGGRKSERNGKDACPESHSENILTLTQLIYLGTLHFNIHPLTHPDGLSFIFSPAGFLAFSRPLSRFCRFLHGLHVLSLLAFPGVLMFCEIAFLCSRSCEDKS